MTRPRGRAALLALLLVVASCASASDDDPTARPLHLHHLVLRPEHHESAPGEPLVVGPGDRPAQLIAPAEVAEPAPLLVLLHGYGSNAAQQDAYLGVTQQAASRGLYVLLPNGTKDEGARSGTPALRAATSPARPSTTSATSATSSTKQREVAPIDPKRIYVFGHSNGGFMAYRLACERPTRGDGHRGAGGVDGHGRRVRSGRGGVRAAAARHR